MQALAYGSMDIMLWESVVRAAVARYVREHRGDSAALAEVRDQQAVGFVRMPELDDLFGEYEVDRVRYPALDAFMPRVVEYYTHLALRIGTMVARFDAQRL